MFKHIFPYRGNSQYNPYFFNSTQPDLQGKVPTRTTRTGHGQLCDRASVRRRLSSIMNELSGLMSHSLGYSFKRIFNIVIGQIELKLLKYTGCTQCATPRLLKKCCTLRTFPWTMRFFEKNLVLDFRIFGLFFPLRKWKKAGGDFSFSCS